jgi:hypothetical protein
VASVGRSKRLRLPIHHRTGGGLAVASACQKYTRCVSGSLLAGLGRAVENDAQAHVVAGRDIVHSHARPPCVVGCTLHTRCDGVVGEEGGRGAVGAFNAVLVRTEGTCAAGPAARPPLARLEADASWGEGEAATDVSPRDTEARWTARAPHTQRVPPRPRSHSIAAIFRLRACAGGAVRVPSRAVSVSEGNDVHAGLRARNPRKPAFSVLRTVGALTYIFLRGSWRGVSPPCARVWTRASVGPCHEALSTANLQKRYELGNSVYLLDREPEAACQQYSWA